MKNLVYLYLLFVIYSVVGYICEMIYMAIKTKGITNRGFLCGPFLPIYGFGAVFMVCTLTSYREDPLVVFVFSAIICTILEYLTSVILEKIFHNMWWDYFDYRFNLNGRVCLLNTILFGIGGFLIICVCGPFIDKLLYLFSYKSWIIFSTISLIILLIDTIYSVIVAYNLRNRLIIVEELKNEKLAKIPQVFNSILKKRVSNFKIYPKRLLQAFPKINADHFKEFKIMKLVYKKKKEKR
ncbi:MAG: hypothetical protein E7158_00970 [Firmicutes bacterium]|nr:hypothetical protein [Bacillota bacterium]